MSRVSSIHKLPPAIRDKIGDLLRQGRTLDEIKEALDALDVEVSRSALGRYKRRAAAVAERLERQKAITELIVEKCATEDESRATRANLRLIENVIQVVAAVDEPDGGLSADENSPFTPAGVMYLAKAQEHAARAKRQDIEFVEKIRAQEKAKADAELRKRLASIMPEGDDRDLKDLTTAELEEAIRDALKRRD